MSIEALWYASYSPNGEPPLARRLCRFPMIAQWWMTIDLAIAFAEGTAGYRKFGVERTGEKYWYWPNDLTNTGWWLIPHRIIERVFTLQEKATNQAFRLRELGIASGSVRDEEIAAILRHWRRTRSWSKYAWGIYPKRGEEMPRITKKGKRLPIPLPQ